MGTLDRYHKAGGFLQLLQLIETCTPEKKQKFIKMVNDEDPRWGRAIEQKLLTFEMLFEWPDTILNEIAGTLQDLTVATVLHDLSPERAAKLQAAFSAGRKRKVLDLFESGKPTKNDIFTAQIKVLTEVRKMITDGFIKLDTFRPDLAVHADIEDELKKTLHVVGKNTEKLPLSPDEEKAFPVHVSAHSGHESHSHASSSHGATTHSPGSHAQPHAATPDDSRALRHRIFQLEDENTQLKQEISHLRFKLDQIRKIC